MARILIVDDEKAIRQLVSAALHDFGHQCADAADAAAARVLLEEHPFDLVISDVNMPEESGLDFIAHVIQTYPDTATLILSVLDTPAVTQRAIDLGIYGYVVKPFDFASLRIAVDGALKRRALEIANRRYRQNLEQLVEERTRQLRAQQRDYEILLKTLPCIVYTGRKDWSVCFLSDQFEAVTGYPREVFLSGKKRWNECILPEDFSAAVEAVKKAMTNDGAFLREYRIRDGQGRVRWIQDRGRIVFDENGAVDHVCGVLFDITERREAREALKQAKEEWERTFDAVPALIDVTDKDFRIRKVNEAFARRVGMPREHIIGRFCYEILRGLPEKCPQCPYGEGGPPSRFLDREVYNAHLGAYFRVTSTPYYNSDGSPAGCISVSHDITALKKAEEDARSAHRELEQLIAAIPSVLIGLDAQGRIVRWNATAENVFGLRALKVLGKPLESVPIEWQRDRLEAAMTSCRQKRKPQRVDDLRYTRPDGQPGFLGLTLNPVDMGLRQEMGILIMGADITQRKLLEAQLAQAQKLESIGQLAAGIAHEINTPVQFIGDNTRFLQEAFRDLEDLLEKYRELLDLARQVDGLSEAVRAVEETADAVDLEYLTAEIPKAVAQTLEGVHRVAKIVLAMKEFSHPGQEEKVPTDINKALENTLTVARNEWKYTADVIADFDPQLPLVPCIPGEINQVFLNIIVNAAHAIKEALNGQPDAKGTITVKTRAEDDWCEIRIQDTGTGIPEKIRHRIFDPFFTTKEVGKGTGQGLAIAHAVVVEKHKGHLGFESEEGKGTTFIIRLPLESP
uniref:histidine kinase n=1 Tax=Desulfacinum infernum TaxID=35837 RepID=A0A832A661_9BACT